MKNNLPLSVLLSFSFLCLNAASAPAASGDLDTSFDGDGKVTTDFPGGLATGLAAARQADGKLIVAGEASADIFVARRNVDGSPDTTFGDGGIVIIDFGLTGSDVARVVAVLGDGKILVGGSNGSDFALIRLNANGSFDNSFDGDGIVTTDFGSTADAIIDLAILPDGRVLAFGQTSTNGVGLDFALARYNTDGSPDNSFSGDGKLVRDFRQNNDIAGGVALQSDGLIVVAGSSSDNAAFLQPTDFVVARLNADGSPDNSFDGDGVVYTDVAASEDDGATDVLVQPDGKIVAAGYNDVTRDFTLLRYNANGSPDNTFDTDGKVFTDFGGNSSEIRAITLDPSNRIVAVGSVSSGAPTYQDFALARYNSNGSPDTSLNGTGRTSVSLASTNNGGDGPYSVLVQPNGAIVAAGVSDAPEQGRLFALVRWNDNGSLDGSLDGDGKLVSGTGTGGYDIPEGVALQTDGRIVVAGSNGRDFTLARYNTDGSLDSTFGSGGKVVTDFGSPQDNGRGIVIQPDGRILVAGRKFRTGTSFYDIALARYHANGTPDTTFDADGLVVSAFGAVSAEAYAVALTGDGKILVAGQIGNDFALLRYDTNGFPDMAFDGDGRVTTDFGSNGDVADSMVVYGDGRILLAGTTGAIGSSDFALARYNADGTPDTLFDTDGKVTTNMGGYDIGRDLALAPDGKIVVAGLGASKLGVARYNENGTPDTSFDDDGRVTMTFGGSSGGNAVAIQSDNKILVAGTTFVSSTLDFLLVRLDTNGAVDGTFGTGGSVSTNFSVQDIPSELLLLPDNRIVVVGSIARNSGASTLDFALARYLNDGAAPPPPSPSPSATASPSPTAAPSASPSPPVSPSPEPSASPSPTPSPLPSASPTPGATATPLQLLNIATRLRVQTGENVLIGGVIVGGTEPKKVIIRAIGPSLSGVFEGALRDTTLELYQGETLLGANDNWKDTQQEEIEATTIPPGHELESAIVYTLDPGFYTAVMSGKDGAQGIGVVEVYDLDQAANSQLANIASRGFVEAGDGVMIGGLIVGGNGTEDARILLRAIGQSLGDAGVADALRDPTLELRDANGELLLENDNWEESQRDEIEATTIPPSDPAESALLATLPSGDYTAIVRGKGDTTGVALVEVYQVP